MERVVREGLTFDDVLLLPRHSTVLPCDAELHTRFARDIVLSIPVVSAAMDTVTEHALAIALAKEGGLGFIHKNMGIEEQAAQVRKVKRFEAGVVVDPVTISPESTVGDVVALREKTGFGTFPVVDSANVLLGLVTNQTLKYCRNNDTIITEVMTPRKDVITVTRSSLGSPVNKDKPIGDYISPSLPFTPMFIRSLLFDNRVDVVAVINEDNVLSGLICQRDFEKFDAQPNACRDIEGRLRVGAAVGCGPDTDARVEALIEAGVDAILVDSSHGHSEGVLATMSRIRANYPNVPLVGGNVCTEEGALALIEAGADCIKCGIGPGSICTTRIVTGVGCPQFTAIAECAKACIKHNVPLIADGGIRYSGDLAKALAVGASCVMIGSMLAGTDETPGTTELIDGVVYKGYRGMGSLAAMERGSADRYFQNKKSSQKFVPEGVEGRVPYKGPLKDTIHQLMGGLRSCMGLVGCKTIDQLRTEPKFVRISSSSVQENHPHTIVITRQPPNYRK